MPGLVAENRQRVAGAVGVDSGRLLTATQTHSTRVVQVSRSYEGKEICADGLVTDIPGMALGVLTADCQPVLLADAKAGIVGAVHAGWKGTLGGILENAVAAMEEMGAVRNRIAAAIGPAISVDGYEVGPEYKQRFLAADAGSEQYFSDSGNDRIHFDLPGYGLDLLKRTGIGSAEWTGQCTFSDEHGFFSHRRSRHQNESRFGLQISVILNS